MSERNVGAELLRDLADHLAQMLVDKGGLDSSVAEDIANEAVVKIADHWGGQAVYVPMDMAAKLCGRNAEIYDAFNGQNIPQLIRDFGLSRQAIYRIIAAERQRRQGPARQTPKLVQGSLLEI